jgi:hypothetical protein
MKFIHEGNRWIEFDDMGEVVNVLTNAQHAVEVKRLIAEHAHAWFVAHPVKAADFWFPDSDKIHFWAHALRMINDHGTVGNILSAMGVN